MSIFTDNFPYGELIYEILKYRETFHCDPNTFNDIFEFLAYNKTNVKLLELQKGLGEINGK